MTALHVLIVDDDPALLQALPEALRLRMDGVTVDVADSAAAALERIAARDYDVIVTDIKMPGMDGLALMAEIRRRQPDTPTLMITGHGEYDLAVRALRGGAYDFMQKPIDRDSFVASLYRAIRAHALIRRVKERQSAMERCASELEQIAEKLWREQACVLIVDDDPALLEALPQALRLRMRGLTVETADSAAAALDRIAARDYDVIVTDIKMPGMDGLALLAEIRGRQPDTPTLMITGHGEHDLAVQALRGGAYDFMQKPIDREYFVASLIRAMQARQYKRQLDDQQHTLERHASDLERTIQERTRELQFLADASRILTASLDSEATLKSIARLAVPRLADMCMTFLAESDGQVRRVEVVHSDPAKEQRLRKLLERYPFNAVASEPTATVLRTGQALLVPEISEEWARGLGPHTEELSVARTLGSVSLIIVPLMARGRTLGVIAFLTAESNRRYTRDDLALVEELARRAALAIDNARLYEQERRIAETLQRSLLPQRLPPIPGIASAAGRGP